MLGMGGRDWEEDGCLGLGVETGTGEIWLGATALKVRNLVRYGR